MFNTVIKILKGVGGKKFKHVKYKKTTNIKKTTLCRIIYLQPVNDKQIELSLTGNCTLASKSLFVLCAAILRFLVTAV